ncbi:synapse-associated protein 1-like isoform X2 [Ostrea edulis]|uniref:synapse-associated protein 1-like isoform X2 n=1 Tax=Ostrea edulis TaxID=37623 RepID=UPI0024AF8184|nr:synapse-associated protein 1-like isoform X2 [Ostrea edulis]
MFSSVTSWLGVVNNKEEEEKDNPSTEEEKGKTPSSQTEQTKEKESVSEPKSDNSQETGGDEQEEEESLEKKLEDASAAAINTAKEWGSYLYSFSKTAGKTVVEKAKQISKEVEEKTFLGDFSKEQNKFVSEKKEKSKNAEAAVSPWVGYNEEESMKTQILALSQDKRNFLRNPPAGVQFHFDFESMFPVAMATLQEDENLNKMRFELVPKQIKEEAFWRNYFYRVSLIKQSTQLTSLAQETGSTSESKSSDGSRRSSTGSQEKDLSKKVDGGSREEEFAPSSPNENEFVSDSFQGDEISQEDLKKEMQMLGVDDSKSETKTEKEEGENHCRKPYERNYWKVCYEKDLDPNTEGIPQWEQELQQELQDYEMVDDNVDDADIENEILQQLEEEATDDK